MKIKWKLAKKLDIGLTNKNYFYKNKIIRESELSNNNFLDHNNEILVLKYVKKLNVPVINYFYENKKFYYVTKFIKNTNNFYEISLNSTIIKSAAKIIKKLHKIKTDTNIKIWDWKYQLNNFKILVKKPLHNLENNEKKVINFFKNYQPKKITLCHNDLVPGNFLITNKYKKIYLIDYEYAMLNDPLFDIASFISETLYKYKWLINYFLEQFNLNLKDKEIIFWWIQYQNIIWYYWANYFWELTKNDIYYQILNEKWKALNEKWKLG